MSEYADAGIGLPARINAAVWRWLVPWGLGQMGRIATLTEPCTHRQRPSRSLDSIPRREIRGVIPRRRSARRDAMLSYALSVCSLAGRRRGRPAAP